MVFKTDLKNFLREDTQFLMKKPVKRLVIVYFKKTLKQLRKKIVQIENL